jgi:hypothetical protein
MSFDPYNHFLKIQESIKIPTPKVGTHLGCMGSFLTPSYTPESMKCDSWASFSAFTFVSFCLSCKLKARVTIGYFCIQERRLCWMNLRWWKARSLTKVTYPHILSPMLRHKKWWVQMSIGDFQTLKIYLYGVILVTNHAWFTFFFVNIWFKNLRIQWFLKP